MRLKERDDTLVLVNEGVQEMPDDHKKPFGFAELEFCVVFSLNIVLKKRLIDTYTMNCT